MSAEITNARQTRGLAGDLRAPWIGLLAFLIAFMWKPAAHTLSVVNHLLMPGGAHYLSGAVIGVAGFVLVWMGFRRDELTATGLGFMGGSFIFMGLVEPSFQLFAELMGVAPLMQEGATALSPNLLLMQASAISYFVVLIFLGADKDTRCRMFLWFHRNLKLRPNAPTPGYRRQPARIAALETVMVSWFFYIVIITVCDPRILGRTHPATFALFWVVFGWGLWLVFFRLARYRSPAAAIRYAIPVANFLWFNVEMGGQWRWFTEVWVKPVEFPVPNLAIAALFLGAAALTLSSPNRGGEPAAAGRV